MSDSAEFDHAALLRKRVALMRELGVTKWSGIELGPAPPAQAAPAEPETPESKAIARVEALRDEYRDKLAHLGHLTDEQIDGFIGPERLMSG